ncbi:MAG: hypothetical protein IPN65_06510 [Elusimicrobia bacterium]|jgi:hypothetical protein|nr:hypothetical protein [Elusimicrobiota bacterium]MBK7207739.1 hypothetical protein [Elusimicrobiota bacterium]MBK7544500.1 hypothetical protein [Elusimicrobiota bacterium]MBK7574023.1 hypothetical protein [Elusimicrobiota bacterium]MBK7689028.1 hypothetical protein [Elusimicrobiota bacterium]
MRRVPTRKGCVLGVPLVLGGVLVIGGPIPKSSPSEIAEIRAVYKEVESLRVEKTIESKTVPISEFEDATLYADSEGRARLYIESLGGQDSVVTVNAYYDRGERLRFVFCRAGAVNETILERRYYMGKNGKTLKKNILLVKGPGYPWDWETLEKEVVFGRARSPKDSFNRFKAAEKKKQETTAP